MTFSHWILFVYFALECCSLYKYVNKNISNRCRLLFAVYFVILLLSIDPKNVNAPWTEFIENILISVIRFIYLLNYILFSFLVLAASVFFLTYYWFSQFHNALLCINNQFKYENWIFLYNVSWRFRI